MLVNGATILITGGTGLLGRNLVRLLLPLEPASLIVYSRNEASQVAMSRLFADARLSFRIGDIRDKEALLKACEGVDCLFHLAELKDAAAWGNQPEETIKTNIAGTANLLEAAAARRVKKVVFWSSEQAARVSTLYGLSKAIGEKLTIHANTLRTESAYVAVRGAELLESASSVTAGVPAERPPLRPFLPAADAARLLLRAAIVGLGGETFVMKVPLYRTADLAALAAAQPQPQAPAPSPPDRGTAAAAPQCRAAAPQLPAAASSAAGGSSDAVPAGLPEACGDPVSAYERQDTLLYDRELLIILPALLPEVRARYADRKLLTALPAGAGQTVLSAAELAAGLPKPPA